MGELAMVWLLYRRASACGGVSAGLERSANMSGLEVWWYDSRDPTTRRARTQALVVAQGVFRGRLWTVSEFSNAFRFEIMTTAQAEFS